jgi:hypothetical protein
VTRITVTGESRANATSGAPANTDPTRKRDDKSTKKETGDGAAATEDGGGSDGMSVVSSTNNDALVALIALVLLIGAGLFALAARVSAPLPDVPVPDPEEPQPPAPEPAPSSLTELLNSAAAAAEIAQREAGRVSGASLDATHMEAALLNADEAATHIEQVTDRLAAAQVGQKRIDKLQKATKAVREALARKVPDGGAADERHRRREARARDAADRANDAVELAYREVLHANGGTPTS